MHPLRTSCFSALVLLSIAACSETTPLPEPSPPDPDLATVRLDPVVTGLSSLVDLATPPGDSRLFIVEQRGRVLIVQDGTMLDTPFLDIRDRVVDGGERGLLGLAFPPDFATTGVFYVDYTGSGGETRVSRFRRSSPDRADPASEEILLRVDQPFSNHNGGQIAFGPDGMLYVALGDGGSGGDPLDAGQDASTLLGSLLRIDVSGSGSYRIPPDNPFVGQQNRRDEIWATGLRNPWRFSFDAVEGRIYIGDVGQNRFEEINVAEASTGGLNYGWNRMEGLECFQSGCDQAGLTLPVYVYGRSDGCSVTGGIVYRGTEIPALRGAYLFSDFCQGWIRALSLAGNDSADVQQLDLSVTSPSAFGVDDSGEVYVVSLDGSVFRLSQAN